MARRTTASGAMAATGAMLLAALVAGCDAPGPATPQAGSPGLMLAETGGTAAQEAQIAAVRDALLALGPGVDAREAARAAEIAVRAPLVWAQEWQVVDSPLVHNFKVTNGLREKGVCRDWAVALDAALRAERFRSLTLHMGIANARNISLEHVSVVMSARGAPMQAGLLLDPWRIGQGRLWFARVPDDPRYKWETAEAVRAWNAEMRARALANH